MFSQGCHHVQKQNYPIGSYKVTKLSILFVFTLKRLYSSALEVLGLKFQGCGFQIPVELFSASGPILKSNECSLSLG